MPSCKRGESKSAPFPRLNTYTKHYILRIYTLNLYTYYTYKRYSANVGGYKGGKEGGGLLQVDRISGVEIQSEIERKRERDRDRERIFLVLHMY